MKVVEINGIKIFVEEAENYIQINDIQEKDLAEIWEPLKKRYPGFEVTLCIRDMPAPKGTLDSIGAEILEDCIAMKVTPQGYRPYGCGEVTLLEEADFAKFAALHDKVNPAPDMYWTSRRIQDKRDIWRIFAIKKGDEITGYGMLMVKLRDETMGEIFCVEADNHAHRAALFSAMAGCAFGAGRSVVLRMVERGNTHEHEAALAVGFLEAGFYIGYQVRKV